MINEDEATGITESKNFYLYRYAMPVA